ncbi:MULTISPECIES: hypothetical protein [Nostocales]|uniref:Uncharacterized protein n=2 Tax=Nostocales TaxID=1161 RepID=A0ABW8X132_9CYAN|nr:hypothetical protein [Tolypothrix bouteillei]
MNTSTKTILIGSLLLGLGISELLKTNDASKSPQPVAIMPQHDNSFLTAQSRASTSYLNEVEEKPDSSRQSEPEPNKNPIPVSLSKVSHYSKIVYSTVKAKDWQRATENLFFLEDSAQGMNHEINGEKSQLAKLNSKIASLKGTIAVRDRLTAMHYANQITLIAATFVTHFQPRVPLEVTQLNYYGRELEIWTPTGNKAWLHKTANHMRLTWYTVRPSILVRGGIDRAQKFDKLIDRVEVASSAAEYSHLTPPLLQEMDNLEDVFLKTSYTNPSTPAPHFVRTPSSPVVDP